MSAPDWIDAVCALWEISDGAGGTVRSYRVYEKAEFPEAINVYPCAITYITDVRYEYSLRGVLKAYWNGRTEFHLFPGVDKSKYPDVMRYYARIVTAAAAALQLGARLDHFMLRRDEPSITGPVVLQYGSEEPHMGLMVNWEAKEDLAGEFTPAA